MATAATAATATAPAAAAAPAEQLAGQDALERRLEAVGIAAPVGPASGDLAAWRECLSQLCAVYLEGMGAAPAAADAPDALPPAGEGGDGELEPLSSEVQHAALIEQVESYKRESFALRCELDFKRRRLDLLQAQAGGDPVIAQRPLGDFVACLDRTRRACAEASALLEAEGISPVAAKDLPPEDATQRMAALLERMRALRS
eukprot:TRINITY_DN46283_c0_g1_i1.p1 TRINITY_DN46283_c0_g1~~TRINITY_DN46283_c0_g1_i1.p1  ORF type:complete len:231 (+),score=73.92 TRINITY_DN46283_c0_g1_i1:89-694(+)